MGRGLDYYEALGLTRGADDVEIRRAFRKLALKYHPDTEGTESGRQEFNRICEAYDVLSDPKKKGFYDLYGEQVLKFGISDGSGGVKGGDYHFDANVTPFHVFARFFGTSNPFEALDVISLQFQALTTEEKPNLGKQKVHEVHLTLEEIYHGCLKKVTHTRKVLHASGFVEEEQRALTIDCKPGLPDGTRFIFEGEGNRTPKKEPGPVVFVLKSKPHERFSRRGADLVHKVVLPLYQSLLGHTVPVPMLDSRILNVPLTEIVTPGYTMTVPGEGMPKPSGGKKLLLKSAFFLPTTLTADQMKAIKAYSDAFKDPIHGWAAGLVKDSAGN